MIKVYTYSKTCQLPDSTSSGLFISINPLSYTDIQVECTYSHYNSCDTCIFTKKCDYDSYRTLVKETAKILSKVKYG